MVKPGIGAVPSACPRNPLWSTDLRRAGIVFSSTQYTLHRRPSGRLRYEKYRRHGDRLVVLRLSRDKQWAEVRKKDGSIGWIQCDHIKAAHNYEKYPWFHKNATRLQAEVLLSSGTNGSFIVRDSESVSGQLSLSVRFNGRVYHYRINRDEHDQHYVNAEKRFPTLSSLVENHKLNADGLVCRLGHAINRPPSSHRRTYQDRPKALRPRELRRQDLLLKQKLGGGQYGEVYEAYWKKNGMTVAVKTLKSDAAMSTDDFLSEAAVMQVLEHPNLVKLFGVCSSEPPYFIVSEYMAHGNLSDYLKKEKPSMPCLVEMAAHISSAMEYLEENHFIHRDLAARNCLVGEGHVVKVADFGLARLLREDHYDAKSGSKFPIKWTAPEGLAYSRFSNKSDVWSFGVLLWEIMTHGGCPYAGINLNEVYQLLCKGYRMSIPLCCPKLVGKIMKKCWEWFPENRPTFKELHTELEKLTKVFTFPSYVANPVTIKEQWQRPHSSNDARSTPDEGEEKQENKHNSDMLLRENESSPVGNSENPPGKAEEMNLRKLRNTLKRSSMSFGNIGLKDAKTLNSVAKEQEFDKLTENVQQMNLHGTLAGPHRNGINNSALSHRKRVDSKADTPSIHTKTDARSADESGFYEDDSKYTNFSLSSLITSAENLLQKGTASEFLSRREIKGILCEFRQLQRQCQPYLNSIDSPSIRFHLMEKLDIMEGIATRMEGRNVLSRGFGSDGSSNDSSNSSGSSMHMGRATIDADGIISGLSLENRQKQDIQQMNTTLKVVIELLKKRQKVGAD